MYPESLALISKYDIDKGYIDGANPSFIKPLKLQIGEDPDYDKYAILQFLLPCVLKLNLNINELDTARR
jgi:hypothetical protein